MKYQFFSDKILLCTVARMLMKDKCSYFCGRIAGDVQYVK
jgi:hypothetical protein